MYPEYVFTASVLKAYFSKLSSLNGLRHIPNFSTESRLWQRLANLSLLAVLGSKWIATYQVTLCRQFRYGQRYFRSRFKDQSSRVFWLPDTFGYAAQLPK